MKSLILSIALFTLAFSAIGQTPPLQPGSGPGGSGYSHNGVIFSDFTSIFSGDGYWLFEPNQPKPDSADLIVFNHGYGVFNPGPYGQWIEHLVRKGHVVIFPKYQMNDASLPSGYTPNAITGILDALNELNTNPNRVKPRMEHFAIIGHSYGGVITSNLVTEYATYGTPKPQCFMLCQPGTGGFNGGRINSYSGMDTDYNALIVVGEDDIVVGDVFGREIMDSTAIPTSHKNYIIHYEDNYGSPVLEASHNEPLCKNNDYDGGTISSVITGGYVASKQDAVDYYCYWKLADALLNCTFYGTDCEYAFGDTPEQRYMGEWSDGTTVLELEVEPSNQASVEDQNLSLSVYPNPTDDYLIINSESPSNGTVEIYDNQGRLVHQELLNASNQFVEVKHLTKGLYTLVYKGLKTSKTNFIKH
jgi:pimeloyl-ACP methyl ester carboxylesterase